jgi:putative endonuclease
LALILRTATQSHSSSFRDGAECRARNPLLRTRTAYYVYLLASEKYGTLYLGVTNDIVRRVYEHKSKAVAGFTKRYAVGKLVWFEIYDDPTSAIAREKELKKWRRDWKIRLIEESNPQCRSLSSASDLTYG